MSFALQGPSRCPSCSAPMATDQRYCLECGARRPEAREPWTAPAEDLPPAVLGVAGALPRSGGLEDRLRRHQSLISLAGVLLLAMLIGVLLGRWAGGEGEVRAAGAPQVLTVNAPAPATGPVPATPEAGASTTAPTATTTTAPTATTARQDDRGSAPPAVRKLEGLTGREYQKEAEKLPDEIPTGGAAPPKDDKAPAAGEDFEEIG